MRTPTLRAVLATALAALPALLLLAACDAADPGPPDGPAPLDALPPDQQALVVQAFQDVEALFDLGGGGPPAARLGDGGPGRPADWRAWVAAVGSDTGRGGAGDTGDAPVPDDPARLASAPDTTLFTGVYDAANARGYLAVLNYREPQGVGVWSARLQHARALDHDADAATAPVAAVETVDLTFLTHADLAAFLTSVEAGANAYLVGTSADAEAAFASATIDVWRVARVYSPAEGAAVVTYANAELRESVTVRDPVVTQNADGTGVVRDGGASGRVRTRTYGADFAVAADGSVSGTLLRTLTTYGDTADGALVSRTDYAADGTYMETRQRGGDGVVVRETSEG